MDNKQFGKKLESRTRKYTLGIFKLSSQLPYSPEFKVLRNQLTKSATSVGANYREANRARSQADFINKIKICEFEASESYYRLELLKDLHKKDYEKIDTLLKETNELIAIFTSIGNKMKSKNKL